MVWNYTYGFVATIALVMLLGFPFTVWCGLGRGIRAIGYASACGTALLLIVCRAVQVEWPLTPAKWIILAAVAAVVVVAWLRRSTRVALYDLLNDHGQVLVATLVAVAVIGALLGAPILFGDAIQYDGTRNADSFTFTQSAQYMLTHAFYDAPDFDPKHPVYAISRGYFGEGAMQPRPAAEGLLAWMSAMRGVDPMYLYNAMQAAGVMLAGLAVLVFFPLEWRMRSKRDWVLLPIYIVACPTLLHIAVNSNFANGFSLPAAAAYVALGLCSRTRGTFVAGVLFIGCLISGYPELLAFVVVTRGLGAATEAIFRRAFVSMLREAGLMLAELVVACALLPWAALGALTVYRTTLDVSHAGASDLGGNMYAGVPVFAAAAIALALAWRSLGTMEKAGRRLYLLAILAAFALAQGLMFARDFDYGGFKISQYFVTLLIGVALRSLLNDSPRLRLNRVASAFSVAVAMLMVVKSADILRRAWDWANTRHVTPDLIEAGKALARISHGLPVALGSTPQPFYYGMWVPYVASVPIAYDLARDPSAAGYLSPYLRQTGYAEAMFNAAELQLDVDVGDHDGSMPLARFGRVAIRPKEVPDGAR